MEPSTTTVLRGGRVFDGTGAAPFPADVRIEHGRIAAVGPELTGETVVDIGGKTLLPGLIDSHVHVMSTGLDLLRRLDQPFSYGFYLAARNLSAMLDCGITSARDAGGADLGIKSALQDGLLEGPRLRIAITMMSQTGGHGDGWRPSGCTVTSQVPHPGRPSGIADGVDGVRLKVREIVRAGADVIKICTTGGVLSPGDDPRHSQYSAEEVAAVVMEASATGRPVMAHAQSARGIRYAVRAGARSVEHGIHLDDETIEEMLEHDVWLVPTLAAPHAIIKAADAGLPVNPAAVEKAKGVAELHMASFAKAAAAGVRIAMGTDSGVGEFGDNLDELALMAQAGMSPTDVLVATTSRAAELLGLDDETGTIAVGKRADLVVVEGELDHFEDLKARIGAVYQDGIRIRG
ncbi:MAG: amidohydrolase family protein [Pseudonocardia sp.]